MTCSLILVCFTLNFSRTKTNICANCLSCENINLSSSSKKLIFCVFQALLNVLTVKKKKKKRILLIHPVVFMDLIQYYSKNNVVIVVVKIFFYFNKSYKT